MMISKMSLRIRFFTSKISLIRHTYRCLRGNDVSKKNKGYKRKSQPDRWLFKLSKIDMMKLICLSKTITIKNKKNNTS